MAITSIHREPMTSDLIFKAVFGSDKTESKRALISLLNCVLDRREDPIIDLVYKNPFSDSEYVGEKMIIMDIKVETSSGEFIDIEVQTGHYNVYVNRSIYNGCKQLSGTIVKGERYDLIKPSIVISFIKEKLLPDIEEMHNEYVICHKKYGTQLSDLLELHYIELGKIDWKDRDVSKLSSLEQIGAYFICSGKEEERQFIEELVNNGTEVISMADNILKKVSQDEKLRNLRESREMAQMEFDWSVQLAEKRGLEQGLEL